MNCYFDNNATASLLKNAGEEMLKIYDQFPGNTSSPHQMGKNSRDYLEELRLKFKEKLKLSDWELFFSSRATESNNTLVQSLLQYDKTVKQVVVSGLEHHSLYLLKDSLFSVPVIVCKSNFDGTPDLNHLEKLIKGKRTIVCMMHVNNETGVIFPIDKIGQIVHQYNGHLHVDACQSIGKAVIGSVIEYGDSFTFSGHKFHGPIGVAGLGMRNKKGVKSLFVGGGQEGQIFSGTVNLPAIGGAYVALEESLDSLRQLNKKDWNVRWESFLREKYQGCVVVGRESERCLYTSMVCFPGIEQDDLLEELSVKKIFVGKGSACGSNRLSGSHVLENMGLEPIYNQGSIRFSFSRFTTEREINYLINEFPECYNKAMERSPYAL